MKNLLVAQSGGPSAAINATLCGVVEKGLADKNIDKVYGAQNGIIGILAERMVELNALLSNPQSLQLLCQTPSSALGSCRMKLSHWEESTFEFEKIISIFRKYNIGYFIYIGGNDSMDTVHKLSEYCRLRKINDICIMGAPKTIDNDLMETDHCPGFGSAAKYIATTFSEIACDCNVYALPAVTIVEVMGRDAGWLTASSVLGRINGDSAPDLIYLCEKPFSVDGFLRDVREKLGEKHAVVIAVSEGIKNEAGEYITDCLQDRTTDAFGHKILAGAAKYLEEIVRQEIGCKVRSVELNLMQRCASHVASAADIYESRLLGMAAADYAMAGGSGKMAAIKRISTKPYQFEIEFVEIEKIANQVKTVPLKWIHEQGNDVTQEMIDYLLPLIQGELPCTYENGVPVHFRLF
ncbi:6-phosphofructokinase [Anaerotignum propionicum]|uniref:Pyrophosphate--fructose 6-phosphate 1-phosphotransferase n=1 Tax=Anaerotignum propionicum DSM 1682 TaxID=991789 RepID=A0A0X1U7N6_ANAPI|nr:6-phosphofructokinase [Anaerotignum propionicum]AMJ40943.1 pyrophosphate--fructose 6-phosphate 1-phosphotransferase [Anaerotignum propionicum DSM 1682]SHE59418.1 6-phosphofructokinase 1 [[Clostridium] propionicum DSM 1682] [Anaerotignum propionicum DSM 1682]